MSISEFGPGWPADRRGATVAGRASRWMTEPSAIATAALIAFSSSRTLPGQVCCEQRLHRLGVDLGDRRGVLIG